MKREKTNRTRIIGLRLTLEEYAKIESGWKSTTCRKLSEYVRKCLFGKPVTTFYRNKSADEGIAELCRLRNELNSIGHNLNQAVKQLHTLKRTDELRNRLESYELQKRIVSNKLDEIKKHMKEMVEKWL